MRDLEALSTPCTDQQIHTYIYSLGKVRKSAKWNEESGFAPNILQEKENFGGSLHKRDMLFAKYLDGTLGKLVVQVEHPLKNVEAPVSVVDAESLCFICQKEKNGDKNSNAPRYSSAR